MIRQNLFFSTPFTIIFRMQPNQVFLIQPNVMFLMQPKIWQLGVALSEHGLDPQEVHDS